MESLLSSSTYPEPTHRAKRPPRGEPARRGSCRVRNRLWRFLGLRRFLGLPSAVILIAAVGCGGASEKESHFEHDHEVKAHYPDGIAELAVALRGHVERLRETVGEGSGDMDSRMNGSRKDARETREAIDGDTSIDDQLRDLVGWVGEVAGDTDLSETDWNPLYEASESLRDELARDSASWSTATVDKLAALSRAVEAAGAKLSPNPSAESADHRLQVDKEPQP